MKKFFELGELFTYFFKSRKNENVGFTTKAMHFINRLAIIVFLIGIVVIIYRRF